MLNNTDNSSSSFQTSRTKTQHERRKKRKKNTETKKKDIKVSKEARGTCSRGSSGEKKSELFTE